MGCHILKLSENICKTNWLLWKSIQRFLEIFFLISGIRKSVDCIEVEMFDIFCQFSQEHFPIFIFWYKHLIKSWMFTNQIFFYPENAIQSFKQKLLSMTYWYSKLLQNIVAQFQPRKLCQELIYFKEAIFSFKLLLLTPSISPRNLRTFKVCT